MDQGTTEEGRGPGKGPEVESLLEQAQKPAVKVLNYMSLGLPVVCDPLPAYKDLGENEKELLFADTLQEWRSQMKRLLEDRELRVRLGEAARRAAEPFSIQNICKRYLEFFERAVAAKASPARSLQAGNR